MFVCIWIEFMLCLCASGNGDAITMKAGDEGDVLTLTFVSPNRERVSRYDLKLMHIGNEQEKIPCQVRLKPVSQFLLAVPAK